MLITQIWINLYIYRVTHKGWDFRDDCTEFIKLVFLHSGFLEDQKLADFYA